MSWTLTFTLIAAISLIFLLALSPHDPLKSPHQKPVITPSVLPTYLPITSPSHPASNPPGEQPLDLDTDDFNDEDDFNDLPFTATSTPSAPLHRSRNTAQPQIAGHTQDRHQVTRVIDGDTIQIDSGETIRLIGIDTPESVHPREPVACFGKEAATFTRNLLQNQFITLESDITDRDRYGRLLRYVYLNGQFINLYLVAEGYATSYPYPPDIKYQSQLETAEADARTHQRGLWNACPSSNGLPSSIAPPPNSSCRIKGNINSNQEKIYHLPDCPYYNRTSINSARGEQYFCSTQEAEAAGWRRAQNCP